MLAISGYFTHGFVINKPGQLAGGTGGLHRAAQVSRLPHLELGPVHRDHGAVGREI